jgi:hypothetical protein
LLPWRKATLDDIVVADDLAELHGLLLGQ